MAGQWRWCYVLLLVSTCLVHQTEAIPAAAFPFNSQVPAVARVDEPYYFQISASTFMPYKANFAYSLTDQPAWLSINSVTRMLSGTPSSVDAGSSAFTLTASDEMGTAHMPCTIVVSSDPAPQLEGDISRQLASTTNLSSTQPPAVTLLPSTPFSFHFERSSFIDIVQRTLYYYATVSDHTPLPSWIFFDPEALTFSGRAPELSAFPQSWSIDLIASDIEGFAGASATFQVAVGEHQLVFVPEEQVVNITVGSQIQVERLSDTLFLNGVKVPMEALASAQATVPEWLSFDPSTLAITGLAPANASNVNVTITAKDLLGNEATASVKLNVIESNITSLFVGKIGTLNARSGQGFEYHFSDDLFASNDIELKMLLPAPARWLTFNADTRTLSGEVPSEPEDLSITATLSAKSEEDSDPQDQTFTIKILPALLTPSSPDDVSPRSSRTPGASNPSSVVPQEDNTTRRLTSAAIAGIVVGIAVALLVVGLCLFLCCRRRKKHNSYVETGDQFRPSISRPILPTEPAILVTTEVDTDAEKHPRGALAPLEEMEDDPPPQIALDLPTQSQTRRMKWSKGFSRISQVSSIGNGEDAIRADSNIPELGQQTSEGVHTPHDSFSVPTQIARSSRQLSDLSPSKRAWQRLQRQRQSGQSVGLGIDTGEGALIVRHSMKSARSHRRSRSGMGMSTAMDGSSVASVSTTGTGILSTKASDFPRPHTCSTFGSRPVPSQAQSIADKRKSIRLVDRSDSIADNRSIEEKRRSFIRNRASTSLASPLFARGTRLSSNPLQNGQTSEASITGSGRRSRRGKSQVTTYSESSSLVPSIRDSRRLSARVRSAFAPSYPRAVTKSTLGADGDDTSSGFETVSPSVSGSEWRAEMALPRHERSWVLPNEASPTPPPAPPTSRQPSASRGNSSKDSEPRQRLKDRFREHSASPLSTAVAVPITDPRVSPTQQGTGKHRRNRLSEPIDLVSSDSLSRGKLERPRLVQTPSKRPVSVEKIQRLSSLKAESDDARPGSEMWEAMEEAGLMPPNSRDGGKEGTRGSDMSGPAFI